MNSPTDPGALTRSFHDWATLRAQMVFVFDAPILNGSSDGEFERNGEYSAWLVRRGWARVKADGVEMTAREGEWLFCFANSLRQVLSDDAHLLSVRMRNSWPQGELLFRGQPLLLLSAGDAPRLEPLATQMLNDVHMPSWEGTTPGFTFLWQTRVAYREYLRHQRAVLEWMEVVEEILSSRGWQLRIPGGVSTPLAHVLNAIDLMPYSAPFPGEKLVHDSGLTVGQLNRMCQRAYGQTIYGYWEQRRMEQAMLMLGQHAATVKETASFLGFTQLSHFSAWFKRHNGVSPREYRNGNEGSKDLRGAHYAG